MSENQELISSSTKEDTRNKYLKDGVIFPLKVFDGNMFNELKCIDKYQEFRKNCEVSRTVPNIEGNRCKRYTTCKIKA